MNPELRTMLPKMAFGGFAARYREPNIEEGFEDITRVDFKVRVALNGTSFDVLLTRNHSLRAQKSRKPFGVSTGSREPWSVTSRVTTLPLAALLERRSCTVRAACPTLG